MKFETYDGMIIYKSITENPQNFKFRFANRKKTRIEYGWMRMRPYIQHSYVVYLDFDCGDYLISFAVPICIFLDWEEGITPEQVWKLEPERLNDVDRTKKSAWAESSKVGVYSKKKEEFLCNSLNYEDFAEQFFGKFSLNYSESVTTFIGYNIRENIQYSICQEKEPSFNRVYLERYI